MNLAIFGSRSLTHPKVTTLLQTEILRLQPSLIITGAQSEGVSELARNLCEKLCIPLALHFLNPQRAAGKFHHRTLAILENADHVLLIHDGISKGTKNELTLTIKKKIPYTYHKVKISPTEQRETWLADPQLEFNIFNPIL